MTQPDPRRDRAALRAAAPPLDSRIDSRIAPAGSSSHEVYRAASRLRRGETVLLGDPPLVLINAEAATEPGLAAFLAEAAAAPVLLMAAARAASLLERALEPPARLLSLTVPPRWLTPASLRSLADPTAVQLEAEQIGAALAERPPPPEAEAALALAKLGRLLPAVLAAPARSTEPGLSPADILAYPGRTAAALTQVATARVPLEDAPDATIVAFRAPGTGVEHLAIVIGQPAGHDAPLVRVHSECFTGDLLGSLRCDCGPQLRGAIRRVAQEGAGVVLYLSQEGRGIGLVNKLRAYTLQDRGLDTFDANGELGWGADERNYLAAATMLEQLGIRRLRLLTNNPDKVAALIACGLDVAGRESHVIAANGVNDRYLAAKAERFGHWRE